jgi:hypothetical protein
MVLIVFLAAQCFQKISAEVDLSACVNRDQTGQSNNASYVSPKLNSLHLQGTSFVQDKKIITVAFNVQHFKFTFCIYTS